MEILTGVIIVIATTAALILAATVQDWISDRIDRARAADMGAEPSTGPVGGSGASDAVSAEHNGVSHPESRTEPTYGKLHYHGVRGLMACTEIHERCSHTHPTMEIKALGECPGCDAIRKANA